MSSQLAIEISGSPGSLAISRGGVPVWSVDFPTGPTQGGELFRALAEARRQAGKFERIVVGVGPGSYAGIRMAIAAATGLALADGAELVAVPSVCAFDSPAPRWCAIGDARRGAFYFSAVADRRCVAGPRLADAKELGELLAFRAGWACLSTEALPGFSTELARALASHLLFLPDESEKRPLEPIYLREPYITRPKHESIGPSKPAPSA